MHFFAFDRSVHLQAWHKYFVDFNSICVLFDLIKREGLSLRCFDLQVDDMNDIMEVLFVNEMTCIFGEISSKSLKMYSSQYIESQLQHKVNGNIVLSICL